MTITDEMVEAFGQAFWPVNSVTKIDGSKEEIRAALNAALSAVGECQYSKSEGIPEHRCAVRCLYGVEAGTDRIYRAGVHLHEKAKSWGWPDDGEGAFEFIQRTSYEAGLSDSRPLTPSNVPATERDDV
jgi:hypothetical protein